MKKKNFPAPKKEKKKSAGKEKKRPAMFHKEKKLPGFFKGKLKVVAILVAAGIVIALLGGFVSSKLGEKTESAKESNKESVQTEESASDTKNADKKTDKKVKKAEDIDIGDLEGHLASDFIKILRAENYMIRYKTTTVYEGKSYDVETTYAVSGNNIALSSGDRATIVLDKKVYMLNNTDRSMISWDVTQTDNLKRIDTTDMVFTGSSEANGLVCEEYTTSTANIKFFFKDKKLTEIITNINKQDVDMNIIEVSEKVPAELFVVPSDYRNTDISDSTDAERP